MDGYGDYGDDQDLEVPVLPPRAPSPMAQVIGHDQMYGNARGALRPPEVAPPRAMPGMQQHAPAAPHHAMAPYRPPQMDPSLGAVEETLPTSHLLGLSVLMPTVGTVAGMKYAGMWGGLGGALAMGSLLNTYRAIRFMVRGDKESDREALVSGTYAVLGFGASAWLFYKGITSSKTSRPNAEPEDDDELVGVK